MPPVEPGAGMSGPGLSGVLADAALWPIVPGAQQAGRLRQVMMAVAIAAIGVLAVFGCSATAQSETNILTCVLVHGGSEFRYIDASEQVILRDSVFESKLI